MNRLATALTLLGTLALAGCNVTTANSTEPTNVAGENTAAGDSVPGGTMEEQAAALNIATDENAATADGGNGTMSNDTMSNDAMSNDTASDAETPRNAN